MLAAQLPLEPVRDSGTSITGAFEGWYKNNDGTYSILVGYFNRNQKQTLDIPVGPDNHIDPGGPDLGQPTHFLPRRQWGVFTIKVPSDFGTRKLTWTLVANRQTNVITMHLKPEWIVEPYEDAANKNTPPVLKFSPDGPAFTGPPSGMAAIYDTALRDPVTLTTWVTDEGPKVNVPALQLAVHERRVRREGDGRLGDVVARPCPDEVAKLLALLGRRGRPD